MRYHLAKTDPDTYSIDDLERDRTTTWDGVTNPQAVRSIREMRPGDTVLIYHSGKEAGITGIARVTSAPRTDPKNQKSAVVDLEYIGRVDPALPLSEIKSAGLFEDWALVRQGRLSTMPVPDAFVDWLRSRRPDIQL